MECQVSVIVVSYNPVRDKLLTTLQRIIDQKNVMVEIILCDDCSTGDDYFSEAEKLFLKNNFKNYKMYRNEINKGIVENFYGGIMKAKGEYVFMGSPGDYFYDDNSLSGFFNYAKQCNAEICFGNAVYYFSDKKIINSVTEKKNNPSKIWLWDSCDCSKQKKAFFLLDDHILGASILRKRESAVKYLSQIVGICRYIEDNTSLMFALMDNVTVYHYDEYILWYEYGIGFSTSGSLTQQNQITKDFDNAYNALLAKYSDDKNLQFAIFLRQKMNNIRRAILLMTKFPWQYLQKKCYRLGENLLVNDRPVDKRNFPTMKAG